MAKQEEATLLIRIKEAGQGVLDRLVFTFGDLASIAKSVGSTIFNAFKQTLDAYHENELAVHKLNQSLVQQGIFTSELSKNYQAMATELQKLSGFTDEAIMRSQSIIQNFIGQQTVTKDLTKATLDFAAATGMDLESAASLVGKSIGSSTNALARYGIKLEENLTSSEKLAAVTSALSSRFGGQSEQALKGLGVFKSLQIVFGELQEKIGSKLAPIVEFFAQKLLTLLNAADSNSKIFSTLGNIFLVTAEGALAFKFVVDLLVGALGVVGSGVEQVVLLLQGKFTEAAAVGGRAISDFADGAKQDFAEMVDEIQGLQQSMNETSATHRLEDEQNLATSNANKIQIDREQYALEAEERSLALESGVTAKQAAEMQETLNHQAELEKRAALKDKFDSNERLKKVGMQNFNRTVNSENVKNQQSTFSQIETLSSSHNKALAAIGKAAGIANAIINTARGVTLALASFPPPLSFVMAALVGAAGAAQIATIAGVKLADGGIVQATPGGVPAIIGEGGRDEAVIPLDEAGGGMLGNKISITVNGGLLGDSSSAREFALAVDRELLKLRKSNESRAFDSGVI